MYLLFDFELRNIRKPSYKINNYLQADADFRESHCAVKTKLAEIKVILVKYISDI